jgi:hypothetical protein
MSVLSTVLTGWLVLNGAVFAALLFRATIPIVPVGPSRRSCASCALPCAPTIAGSWEALLEKC